MRKPRYGGVFFWSQMAPLRVPATVVIENKQANIGIAGGPV